MADGVRSQFICLFYELNLESFTSLTNILELPNELKAIQVTMKLDGKSPPGFIAAHLDQSKGTIYFS